MLVPLSWLREFTPYEGTAEELGNKLTMLGLELEEIVHPFAAIACIRVGFVAQCVPHPDSDHLSLCKVDLGDGELLDIVCGAPNVAEGQKVAVAPIGCKLPDGTVIRKSKLRGQISCGMICSERELGLSEDHSGIMVLPPETVTGQKLVDALNMDLEVLDLSITPNRSDCLSIIGVARETATAFHLPFHVPELPINENSQTPETIVPVAIEQPELCLLYSGRVIGGVKVAPSPFRLRQRLIAVGVRPISNIVDVTNYILFECGQPLHAFDLDKLAGRRIVVRVAAPNEKFITLDGKERVLDGRDLCICDSEKIVGLAGVMGGLNTEITEESANVFLESAVFQPKNIRGTSRRLGLISEASYRFERGVDQQATIPALNRACALMASIGGGVVNRGLSCKEPRPYRSPRVDYRPASADALLGVSLAVDFQREVLESLGCAVEGSKADQWRVIPPSWRHDLTRSADLIEEVGRVYGLDRIAPELPAVSHASSGGREFQESWDFWRRIKAWAAGLGLNEAINYSFVGARDLDALNLDKENRISIFNPLSEDQNTLRTCLAPGLFRDIANNQAFGAQSLKLFELANAFFADTRSETGAREIGVLGIVLTGARHAAGWPHSDADFDFSDLKGIVENLFSFLHLTGDKYRKLDDHPYLSPCARVFIGERAIGAIGRVRPDIAQKYNAWKMVYLAEIDLEMLRELHAAAIVKFHPLPVYPAVRRDMTVIAPPSIGADDILENILLAKTPLLEGAALIDLFEPKDQSERNLTFRLTFRHSSRTLKDAEADREREKIADFLRKKIAVKI